MEQKSASRVCPSCGMDGLSPFYETRDVPCHSVLLFRSRKEAVEYQRGDIALGFCQACGFITNTAFDSNVHEYSENCEESQGCSDTFNVFQRRLGQRLIDRYNLRHKKILEIGCGKGEFIALLCELGENQGIGYDPAYVPSRVEETPDLKFVRDFYSEKNGQTDADFVCCKMTLEHIPNTSEFLSVVRRSLGQSADTLVFFQVPDITRILSECAFWDIYYEHCSYFSRESLELLFRRCGFEVLAVEVDFGEQYLMIEATPSDRSSDPQFALPDLTNLRAEVENFTGTRAETIGRWKNFLETHRRTVVWGAGSKAVAFLCAMDGGVPVDYIVDINPRKQGTFSAGTGHEIVPPEFLKSYRPENIIVMNPNYCGEIRKELSSLGVSAKLFPVTSVNGVS